MLLVSFIILGSGFNSFMCQALGPGQRWALNRKRRSVERIVSLFKPTLQLICCYKAGTLGGPNFCLKQTKDTIVALTIFHIV